MSDLNKKRFLFGAMNPPSAERIEQIKLSIKQPSYVRPETHEVKLNKGYQTFGRDNKYPDYLLNIYFGSSQHQGIIQRKVDEIVGNGLFSATNQQEIDDFVKCCNIRGQSLNEIIRKAVNDNEIFGGFALQIIYGKGSTKENPIISEIYYIDIAKLRWNLDYTKVKYARDWGAARVKTIQYDLYNAEDPTGTKIFYYSGTMTRHYYPIPQYIGSIPAIETAIDIANFNQNTLRNGFFPSVAITFRDGEPTEEEKAYIESAIQEKWGGTSNTGRFMLFFADKDGEVPEIKSIEQPALDKLFTELKQTVIEDIFIGHRITNPSMFGLQVPGKLGGAQEYTQSYSIFQNVYVKPQRRIFLDVLNTLLKKKFANCDLEVLEIEPVNNVFTDEALIASQMTQSELRTLIKKWGYIDEVAVTPGEKTIVETDIATGGSNPDGTPKTEPLVNVTRPRVKLSAQQLEDLADLIMSKANTE